MRNFNKEEHAKKRRIAKTLSMSGVPTSWIAMRLYVNQRTIGNAVGPEKRTGRRKKSEAFQAAIKSYAEHKNKRTDEAQQIKTLLEDWMGLETITAAFGSLNLLIENLSIPSHQQEHRGYVMFLRTLFKRKHIDVQALWHNYLSRLGMGFPIPQNRDQLEKSFMDYCAKECRKELAAPWSDDTYRHVDAALETLLPREALIIKKRFGIDPAQTVWTLRAIASDIGISAERVRQIERKALQKLYCHPLLRNKLRQLLYLKPIEGPLKQPKETMAREEPTPPKENALDSTKILLYDLPLSERIRNCLKDYPIVTVADLTNSTEAELLKKRGFGRKSLLEVKACLKELGLTLKTWRSLCKIE